MLQHSPLRQHPEQHLQRRVCLKPIGVERQLDAQELSIVNGVAHVHLVNHKQDSRACSTSARISLQSCRRSVLKMETQLLWRLISFVYAERTALLGCAEAQCCPDRLVLGQYSQPRAALSCCNACLPDALRFGEPLLGVTESSSKVMQLMR